ncbi:metal ABC transporter permease [Areca yellow leaf disease phytoplasma]|uniref:metal ABC transporter permease n=1 Tax=Areca yellow leaf disease phytoplasma TaxID=927614 RepID=UPI0035B51B87
MLFFYKELKIYIFDPTLAVILGFSTTLINYLLMFLVSMTAVISFDVVGSYYGNFLYDWTCCYISFSY